MFIYFIVHMFLKILIKDIILHISSEYNDNVQFLDNFKLVH